MTAQWTPTLMEVPQPSASSYNHEEIHMACSHSSGGRSVRRSMVMGATAVVLVLSFAFNVRLVISRSVEGLAEGGHLLTL
jgi:hypothetical protein